MSRRRTSKKEAAPAPLRSVSFPGWLLPAAVFLLALVAFYWEPLTSRNTSIQWDAVDVHWSSQRYFAESVRAGRLPHWTPYVFSGFPFLADPQVGAWYPLNWPFLLSGVPPQAIQWELILHSVLALAGTFLFLRHLGLSPAAATLGSLIYAFSGFFAGHASHVGMFQAASWLPWLLLAVDRLLSAPGARALVAAAATGAMVILPGHFQTALYSALAAALFTLCRLMEDRTRLRRLPALALAALLAVGLSAIHIWPGLILTSHSIRARADFSQQADATLNPATLSTLVLPDSTGIQSGKYTGPVDRTQHYFYAGLLLLPLAALGLTLRSTRLPALLLLLVPLWYAAGPAVGLYHAFALLPGFASVRSPIHIWFVAALALAVLAAAGLEILTRRFPPRIVGTALIAIFVLNLAWANSWRNPLAYARQSFTQLYGAGLDFFVAKLVPIIPSNTRLHAPYITPSFGPQNHALDTRTQTTYGYNPLELARYQEYMEAAKANPKLLDALNVGATLDMNAGGIYRNFQKLPFVHFVPAVLPTPDPRTALSGHDPRTGALVAGASPVPEQDPKGAVELVERQDNLFRLKTTVTKTSLLRFAVPFYPGWTARVAGASAPAPLLAVDHALIGVVVPAGQQEVVLSYSTPGLLPGAIVSAGSVVGLVLAATVLARRKPVL
ncbi:MAG: YfhO family protein [Bryobacteraceae bacterium]|nr:YfhO family protein [Bryobacteraceae bacterium]